MSSFVRRIERTVHPSRVVHPKLDLEDRIVGWFANPARETHYMGRGSQLGIKNPKDKALLARLARESRRSARP